MYVYILLKEYYNNVAVVADVFSSKKKAEDQLDWLCKSAERDGWTVTNNYRYMRSENVFCKVLTPPSGNQQFLERYYILKEKVC